MTTGAAVSGAIVVTVGDEILLGRTVDTNAAWLGRRLAELGIRVRRTVTVADRLDDIVRAVHESVADAAVVVFTGGLGPTPDDLTRESVAAALGRPLEEHPVVLEHLDRFYMDRDGSPTAPGARRVALVHRDAEVILNPRGTAPAILMEHGATRLILLPGVPREMKALFDEAAPRLRAHAGRPAVAIRTWTTSGIPESQLAPRVAEALDAAGIVDAVDAAAWELAFLPGLRGVALRATVPDAEAEVARRVLARVDEVLAPVIAPWRLPDAAEGEVVRAVGMRLLERGWSVATAESCTGGLVAKRITDLAGSSAWFRGGVVAYSNDAKADVLGVDPALIEAHGAVSEEVATAMVEGAAERFGAEAAVSLTGVAGPGGGSDDKPVGTVCWAVRVGGTRIVRRERFHGDREAVRERSTQAALVALLRLLEEVPA